jgi:TolB-like protein/predicted Zn-dependent protease/predicted Ser/Thr protein kinase
MIGKTVAHYRIIEKLGQGGMGVVYKAQDTKLDRMVAIKFLPRHFALNAEERERFKIEAKAAAAINHPNIAHIYAIEEAQTPEGGMETFIVMEYIDGKELKEIVHQGALSNKEALDISRRIAGGLKAAHDKDIVHRDIKCANVMLTTDRQVKIMDFGLAKVRGTAQVTKVGTTLGTAAYMSPEQARGEDVDHRSDIWSLGVVLFEMLCGELPFKGKYEQATTYSILHDDPDFSKIPVEIQQVMYKTLQKKPELRYQNIEELMTDLNSIDENRPDETSSVTSAIENKPMHVKKHNLFVLLSLSVIILLVAGYFFVFKNTPVGSQGASQKMIVVLPFDNLGPAEQEYFADGITGEITSRLSGLSGLGVIARKSAMQYKNTTKSLDEIGEELGIEYVLEGTIQWEGTVDGNRRVRVNPELIKISDATQIWSQPYESAFSSAFEIQSDIALKVANALNVKLLQPERKSLESKFTENSEAYDFYLRGLDFYNRTIVEQDWRIAEEMFQEAIKLDPNFTAAHAKLSNINSNIYWFHYDHSEERILKAKEYVDKALELDPDSPDAHSAKGWYYYHGRLEYENALREFNTAIKLQPNNADAYDGIAAVRRRQGKMDEALRNYVKSAEINPRSAPLNHEVARTYELLRKYAEAEPYFNRSISLAPDDPNSYYDMAWLYIRWDSNTNRARSIVDEAIQREIAIHNTDFRYISIWIEIFDRNYQKALEILSDPKLIDFDDQFRYLPKDLFLAKVNQFLDNRQKMQAYFNSARKILENKVKEDPRDSRFHSALGLANAGLGRKKDAIENGKKAVDMLPISQEAWRGSYRVWDLAQIYTMIGEYNAAIDRLEILLSIPSDFSVQLLQIDPSWDPLREIPRFQQLLGKYSKIHA